MATATVVHITLHFKCANGECPDTDTHDQPLADVPTVGTLICPECAEDMELQETADVDLDGLGFYMTEWAKLLGKRKGH